MDNQNNHIIIAGAGLSGLSMALIMAKYNFAVTVIEPAKPESFLDDKFDGRVSAITKNSKEIFTVMGVWGEIEKNAQPINDIRITEGDSRLKLEYGHELVGGAAMGYIVENRYIRRPLYEAVKNNSQIKIITEEKITGVVNNSNDVEVTISSGQKFSAKLLVAADGKNSSIAKMLGIKKNEWAYSQDAIVCTIKHEKDHKGEAIERFLPAGPFAILPMKGGKHSSLVWTERKGVAKHYINMEKGDFLEEIEKRFGDYLGKLELVEPKYFYPLSLSYAEKYYSGRAVLIGDAAHAIHPVAGQGFNLGLRDIDVLASLIKEAANKGLDIGGATILSQYQTIRRPDNFLMMALTDNLNRLFSNNIGLLKFARIFGMAAVNKIPSLKRVFMLHAMGETGYKVRKA